MKSKKGVSAKQLDLLDLAKRWLAFDTALEIELGNAEEVTVELGFDTTIKDKEHYSFDADEQLYITGTSFSPVTGKLMITAPVGAKNKKFFLADCELINVHRDSGMNHSLREVMDEHYDKAFRGSAYERIIHLQGLVTANLGMVEALNDPEAFIKSAETESKASKQYGALPHYGKY